MKFLTKHFNCGNYLTNTLSDEIQEVTDVITGIEWSESFRYSKNGKTEQHQTAYNKAFADGFKRLDWESNPILRKNPKLIGDFRKGLVFVEIQFGNSSTLYRDYYKFQYGLANGLLSLAVLIVPTSPRSFFPTRAESVQNMAEYKLAETCLTVLPINVPTLLVGLLPGP